MDAVVAVTVTFFLACRVAARSQTLRSSSRSAFAKATARQSFASPLTLAKTGAYMARACYRQD